MQACSLKRLCDRWSPTGRHPGQNARAGAVPSPRNSPRPVLGGSLVGSDGKCIRSLLSERWRPHISHSLDALPPCPPARARRHPSCSLPRLSTTEKNEEPPRRADGGFVHSAPWFSRGCFLYCNLWVSCWSPGCQFLMNRPPYLHVVMLVMPTVGITAAPQRRAHPHPRACECGSLIGCCRAFWLHATREGRPQRELNLLSS